MTRYYVNDNAQDDGYHEVHTAECYWLTLVTSKTDLGTHATCQSAVRKAKQIYANSDGCKHCSSLCHTR